MATGQLAPVIHYLRKVTTPAAAGDVPDAELLSRFARHRDEAAFTTLVRRHGPMVLAVCRRVVRDEHMAEDAFQAAFLVLARKADSLKRPELLGHWLYGVAYRTPSKAKTAAARRRVHEQQAVRTPQVDPNDEFDWHDLRAVLDDEVNRLPDRYRVPVVLCYLQGQTNAEAARRLGCSRGTIATLLARARTKLRRRLTQRGVSLSAGITLATLTQAVRGSAVPFTLEQITVKAAALLAAGQTVAVGALTAQAVALAKGVSKAMLVEKLKIPAVILMMTALVGTGTGVGIYRAGAQESEIGVSDTESKPQPPSKVEKPRPPAAVPAGLPEAARREIRTKNFLVTAPSKEIARQIGEAAERNRKALALLWLGKELPDWAERCPIRVTITDKTINSSSEFQFQDAPVVGKERGAVRGKPRIVKRGGMVLEGPLDRIFADLLPHEMTHTILAEWRGQPLPRWADEGAAMLSESAIGRAIHERAMERLLRSGHLLPLRELLLNHDYPKEVTAFYAQSLSLTDFLVLMGGRKKFLAFVVRGERDGWDKAVQSIYGFEEVKILEEAWLDTLRERLAVKPSHPRQPPQVAYQPEPRPAPPPAEAPKPRPAPVPGKALPASFKEKLPAGPPPIQALVILQEDGRLSVSRKASFYQPVTEVVTLKNGQKHSVSYYEEKFNHYTVPYDFAAVRVHDTKGQAVHAKEVRKRLKGETLVLVSANGRPIDPLHLRLFKEDTLIFVLPPQPLRAVPGRDPIAPPDPPAAPPLAVPVPPSVAPPPRVDDSEESVPPPGS